MRRQGATRKTHTVSNSITFNSDGTVFSQDGQVLNKAVTPNNVVHDSQKANVGIQTRVGTFASYNTGGGPATQRSPVTQVQLNAPTGLVRVPGTPHEVTPAVLEKMKETSPELFVEPEAKAAQEAAAALEADKARSEEISREDLNRHPDDQIEAAHQHFVGEVSTQNQIALLVAAHRGEAPSSELLNRIASEMHEPLDRTIDKINAISMATQAQFTVLARSMGLDADKAADWIRDHRGDSAMAAAQAHGLRRDLMAWKPLLSDYRAATGDGVKR
jgi:hypothetical protein